MKYRSIALFCVLILFVGMLSPTAAEKVPPDAPGLGPAARDERLKAFELERKAVKLKIIKLLQIATAEKKKVELDGSLELSVTLLGDYRAVEAVEFLVENITLRAPGFVGGGDDLLAGYPCPKALVAIGSPSIPAILTRMHKKCDDVEIRLFATVIRRIDGDDFGLVRLEFAKTKIATSVGSNPDLCRKNLDRLIEKLKERFEK